MRYDLAEFDQVDKFVSDTVTPYVAKVYRKLVRDGVPRDEAFKLTSQILDMTFPNGLFDECEIDDDDDVGV